MTKEQIIKQVSDEAQDLFTSMTGLLNDYVKLNMAGKELTPTLMNDALSFFTQMLKSKVIQLKISGFKVNPSIIKQTMLTQNKTDHLSNCYVLYVYENNKPSISFVFDGFIDAFKLNRVKELNGR